MDSQLIVVDFNRVKRDIDFPKLTGFNTDTVSYYRDDLFDTFAAYLFNYERWAQRPLFQLVFLHTENPHPKPNTYVLPIEQDVLITNLCKRYAAWSKSIFTTVSHKGNHTLCGFAPTEKHPDLGIDLQWLTVPIEGELTCETLLSRRSTPSAVVDSTPSSQVSASPLPSATP